MLHYLAGLKPAQLYAAIRLMAESRAGICAVSKLAENPVEAEKMARRLEVCGLVQINTDLDEPVVVLVKPFSEFTLYVQAYAPQLSFNGFDEPAPAKSKKEPSKREDMNAVMGHYADAKGFTGENKTQFIRKLYPRCAKALISLLSEAGSVERACEVIDAVKGKMEKQALDWSLNGAVLNHMHMALSVGNKAGKGAWDW